MEAKTLPQNKGERNSALTDPKAPATDANGEFTVRLFSSETNTTALFDFVITVLKGDSALSAYWVKDAIKNESLLVSERPIPDFLGMTTVTGHRGDSLENIRIFVKQNPNATVFGQIIPADVDPSLVNLSAQQNTSNLPLTFMEQGRFKIEYVSAVPLSIILRPMIMEDVVTPYGIKSVKKYLLTHYEIEIPDNQSEFFVETPLQEAGYLWGHVNDVQGNAIPSFPIILKRTDTKYHCMGGVTKTDEHGFFFLGEDFVPADQSYYIEYGIFNKKIFTINRMDVGNIQLIY